MSDPHAHLHPLPPAGHEDPWLQHHFEDLGQQHETASFGMWVFLVTEILFFGGLFAAYAVYRSSYPDAFERASATLDVALGGINTAVLIGSSLTVALSVHAAQLGRLRAVGGWLVATLALGAVFLAIKGVEYAHKVHEGHVPGPDFRFDGAPGGPEQLFFALYFAMTGLHAFHMIIGIGLIAWVLVKLRRREIAAEHHPHVELFGLYWHFVDVVWIFLFPLLYLVGRHP